MIRSDLIGIGMVVLYIENNCVRILGANFPFYFNGVPSETNKMCFDFIARLTFVFLKKITIQSISCCPIGKTGKRWETYFSVKLRYKDSVHIAFTQNKRPFTLYN